MGARYTGLDLNLCIQTNPQNTHGAKTWQADREGRVVRVCVLDGLGAASKFSIADQASEQKPRYSFVPETPEGYDESSDLSATLRGDGSPIIAKGRPTKRASITSMAAFEEGG